MDRVCKHKDILKVLAENKTHDCCDKIIKIADKDLIDFFCECALNINNGNIPLSSKQYQDLKKYKQHLKTLKNKQTSEKIKKEVLQEGGFLPALAAPILAALLFS